MESEETPLPAHKPAYLRRVQIRGYKSIAFCDVTLEPLTILVGRNASGKSNFLDALGFLRDVVKHGVREAVEKHGGRDSVLCKSVPGNDTIDMHIECTVGTTHFSGSILSQKEWVVSYSVTFAVSRTMHPRVISEVCKCECVGEPMIMFTALSGRGYYHTPLGMTETHSAGENTIIHLRQEPPILRFAELLREFQTYSFDVNEIRKPQKAQSRLSLEADGRNIANVLEATRSEESDVVSRIIRYLAIIVPEVRLIGPGRAGSYQILRFLRAPGGEPIGPEFDASSMSDGTLRALAALTAVFQNVHEDQDLSLVAIEEPETALHPAAMRALVSAFDAATMRTQVLLTTHSPDLLDAEEVKPENVRIVQMIDGQTVIGPIDEASVEIVRRNLDTLGGLERNDSLHIDHDDRQRQLALAKQSSDEQP